MWWGEGAEADERWEGEVCEAMNTYVRGTRKRYEVLGRCAVMRG